MNSKMNAKTAKITAKTKKTCCDCSKAFKIDAICKVSIAPEMWKCFECCAIETKKKYGIEDSDDEEDITIENPCKCHDEIIVSGISCKNCGITLPPMTMTEHLDPNNLKNRCKCDEEQEDYESANCENDEMHKLDNFDIPELDDE